MIDADHPDLSIRRQCCLLGPNRSSVCYEPVGETPENLRLMRLLDEQFTARSFFGSRRMTAWLTQQGESARARGAMVPTEPSGTTMSGRPARRRPGCRHGATTVSIGATHRLPGGHSVPPPSRRPITARRPARPAASKNEAGT
jgi:putative transposase